MCPPADNAQEEGTAPPPAPRSDLRDFLGGLLLSAVSAVFAGGEQQKPFRIVERQFLGKIIVAALRATEWKLRPAARLLGLSPGKVREDMRDYIAWAHEGGGGRRAIAAKTQIPEDVLEKKLADFGIEDLGEE